MLQCRNMRSAKGTPISFEVSIEAMKQAFAVVLLRCKA